MEYKDNHGVTLLDVTANKGHLPEVKVLFSAFADISLRTNED